MWQFHQFTLDASGGANDRRYVDSVGNAVEILDGGNSIQIQIDDLTPFILPEGVGYETLPGQTFRRLQFINTGAAPATVQVGIAKGFIRDARAVFTGAIITNEGDTMTTPAVVNTAGAAAKLIVAASTARNTVIVQNLSATENLWIGDASVGNNAAPRGLKVLPGGALTLNTGAAVYGRRGNATDIDVSVLEIAD